MRMPYRFHAGSWQPARLRRPDHQLILVWLTCAAYVRGFDYLTGDDTWGARDFMLAAAPEWVWGGGFVIGAAILAGGLIRRRHLLVWLGHGWLAIAYGVNAAALAFASGPAWLVALLALSLVLATYALLKMKLAYSVVISLGLVAGWVVMADASGEWLNGVRGAGATGFVAIIHAIYHIRTGVTPIRPDERAAAEVIVGEGD